MKKWARLSSALLLATFLALGAGTVWLVVAEIVRNNVRWDFRPPATFGEQFLAGFTEDGQPVMAKVVPGKEIFSSSNDGDASLAIFDLAGTSLGKTPWIRDIEVPAPPSQSQPWIRRILSSGPQSLNNDQYGDWSLVGAGSADQGAYFAIASRTGEPIGYFGTAGFREDLLPEAERFQHLVDACFVSEVFHFKFLLNCGSEIYLVDIQNRTIETLWTGLAMPTVSNLDTERSFTTRDSRWVNARRPAWRGMMIPGRTFSGFYFRNEELLCLLTLGNDVGNQGFVATVTKQTFKLPASLRGRPFFFGERGDGKLLIAMSEGNPAGGDTEKVQAFSLAEDGTASKPLVSVVPVSHDDPRRLRWPALAALPSPLALLVERDTLGNSSMFGRNVLAIVYLLSAAAALLCYRRESRYYASAAERVVWPLFVLLLGVPGWIGYRYGRRWPVIEPCPTCRRPVPRDRAVCAACHHEFPLAVSQGEPATLAPQSRRETRRQTPDRRHSLLGTLLRKELRESVGIVSAGLGVYLLWTFMVINGSSPHRIPFLSDEFHSGWGFISWVLAIALGIKQSTWERLRGTYLFLLHRPLDRMKIFAGKVLIGLVMLQAAALVPIAIYSLWAGSAATHSTPFDWWMTKPTWQLWSTLPVAYLGAFLTGLLPARWLGTRLAPLVLATAPVLWVGIGAATQNHLTGGAFEYSLSGPGWLAILTVAALASGALIYCARFVVASRDFG